MSSDPPTQVLRPSLVPAVATIVVGLLVVAYGMIAQDPLGPSAVWNGVVDSATPFPSAVPSMIGPSSPTRAVTLYFRKAGGARTLRMPPAFATVADVFHPGDTVRVILGWGGRQDTATALGLTRNGAMLLDSAVVLGAERQRSNRTTLLGGFVGVLGAVSLARRSKQRKAAATPAAT